MASDNRRVIRGEFHTDGATFVFKLDGTPFSGVGATPQAAFDDLLAVEQRAGDLPQALAALAREQASAVERRTIVRLVGAAVVGLTIVGGALGGAVALAPRVVADVAQTTLAELNEWAAELTPEERRSLSEIVNPPAEEAPAEAADEAAP